MSIEIEEPGRVAMLATAREAIESRLSHREPVWPDCGSTGELQLGAFVTLHATRSDGRRVLRGCIGRMRSDAPLVTVIRSMAVAAAFEDPRFPRVTANELQAIDVEISVLSRFEPCTPDEVMPGMHGVYLVSGFSSGVFLPQVATEQGWNREELLEQLCVKAGLGSGAYRSPEASLFCFTATVFGERS